MTFFFSKYDAKRLANYLKVIFPFISSFFSVEEDDELKDICLQAFEIFVLRLPGSISPYIPEITATSLKFLKYDPNYDDVDMDDGNDMDEDDDVKWFHKKKFFKKK